MRQPRQRSEEAATDRYRTVVGTTGQSNRCRTQQSLQQQLAPTFTNSSKSTVLSRSESRVFKMCSASGLPANCDNPQSARYKCYGAEVRGQRGA